MARAEGEPTDGARRRARGALTVLGCVLLAAGLAAGNYELFGREGLNMRDEGYLWYGVRAVLLGEVPLRDFQAYDPGRYYWCAALIPLVGDSVLGIRISSAVFQVFGLTAGLLAARRVLCCDWLLPFVGVFLLAWMFPRHKLFESSITMIGVLAAVRLLERPSNVRHLAAGVVVGLAACFGKNHGLYLGVGLGALVVWLARASAEGRWARFSRFAAGVVLGYLPLIGMMLFVDGFFTGFVDATLVLLDQGANLPAAYPWPWTYTIDAEGVQVIGELGYVAAFLVPLFVYVPAVLLARKWESGRAETDVDSGRRALLLASLFVGVPYIHHFAVRSDLSHLAQAIHPALLALLAFGGRTRPRASALALVALGVLSTAISIRRHPTITEELRDDTAELVTFNIDGDDLLMRYPFARHVDRVCDLNLRFIRNDELFIAPTSPTFYPLLHKRAPDWWIYYLWPASEEQQRETIRRLEEREVNWALIVERSFDADESYAFRETNPLVMEYLEREFDSIDDFLVPPDYTLFRRRGIER